MPKSAIEKIAEAVDDQVSFNGDALDDSPVKVIKDNTEFELVYKGDDDQWVLLTFGDLRELIQNAIGNAVIADHP